MVKTSLYRLDIDAFRRKFLYNLQCNFSTPSIRVVIFIVMRWKAVKVIDQVRVFENINLDCTRTPLPACGEYNYSFWLDFLCDFQTGFG